MQTKCLLIESGGTKSDWAFIENGKVLNRFVASGLHPVSLSAQKRNELLNFLNSIADYQSFPVRFYGAGCLYEAGSKLLRDFLSLLGFSTIEVFSDLHAAGIAAYGTNSGWTAILGTGSVVFHIENGQIDRVEGGKGHLQGDEGSAYYFGRLLLQAWKRGVLTKEQESCLLAKIPHLIDWDIDSMLLNKAETASLAGTLHNDYQLFEAYHKENSELFFEVHPSIMSVDSLAFVGSYAWHLSPLLRQECALRGISELTFIKSPLDRLIEQSI